MIKMGMIGSGMMNIESIIKKLFAFFAIISLFIGIIGCRPNIKNITLGTSDELARKNTSTASIHSCLLYTSKIGRAHV